MATSKDDKSAEDIDPASYPALFVAGFRAPEGDLANADNVEAVQNKIMVHFQKRKNGGGEIVETKLVAADVARVAFEETEVAQGVLARPRHVLRSGEEVTVTPEVLSSATVDLAPLVTQLFSTGQLEAACRKYGTKLCGRSQVAGPWRCISMLQQYLVDCIRASQDQQATGAGTASAAAATPKETAPGKHSRVVEEIPTGSGQHLSGETMPGQASGVAHEVGVKSKASCSDDGDKSKRRCVSQSLTILEPAYKVIARNHMADIKGFLNRTGCKIIYEGGSDISFRGETDEKVQDCLDRFSVLYQEKLSQFRPHTLKVPEGMSRQATSDFVELLREQHQSVVMSLGHKEITVYGYESDVRTALEAAERSLTSGATPLSMAKTAAAASRQAAASTASLPGTGRGKGFSGAPSDHRDQQRDAAYPSSGGSNMLKQFTFPGGVVLKLLDADITTQRVDAIVNAANENLMHGAGVAAAISKAGGPRIDEESRRVMATRRGRPLHVGDAVATGAGQLPCRLVIHTVGPRWTSYNASSCEQELAKACRNSLELACDEQCRSVALPGISCGIFGMPVQVCARVMLQAVRQFFSAGGTNGGHCLKEVRVVLFERRTIHAFCTEFARTLGQGGSQPVSTNDAHHPPARTPNGMADDVSDSDQKHWDSSTSGNSGDLHYPPLRAASGTADSMRDSHAMRNDRTTSGKSEAVHHPPVRAPSSSSSNSSGSSGGSSQERTHQHYARPGDEGSHSHPPQSRPSERTAKSADSAPSQDRRGPSEKAFKEDCSGRETNKPAASAGPDPVRTSHASSTALIALTSHSCVSAGYPPVNASISTLSYSSVATSNTTTTTTSATGASRMSQAPQQQCRTPGCRIVVMQHPPCGHFLCDQCRGQGLLADTCPVCITIGENNWQRPSTPTSNVGASTAAGAGSRPSPLLCEFVGCQMAASFKWPCGHVACDQCLRDLPTETCFLCIIEQEGKDGVGGDRSVLNRTATVALHASGSSNASGTTGSSSHQQVDEKRSAETPHGSHRDAPFVITNQSFHSACAGSSTTYPSNSSDSRSSGGSGIGIHSSTSNGSSVTSTSSTGRSVASTSSTGRSVASSGGSSVTSTSSTGRSVTSTSITGRSVASSSGSSVTSTSGTGSSIASTSAGGRSVTSTSAGGRSVASTSSTRKGSSKSGSVPTTFGAVADTLSSGGSGGATAPPECGICMEIMKKPRTLPCSHQYCSDCLGQATKHGHYLCPECRKPFAPALGNQPTGGTMKFSRRSSDLPGHHGSGHIIITYAIPGGVQGMGHPNPGQRFSGTSRTAYLPDTTEGNKVLGLLRKAFDARLTFTVGQSVTSGANNTVTWNDIHHKTSMGGGPFGYPDATYLNRVQQELAAKGIM